MSNNPQGSGGDTLSLESRKYRMKAEGTMPVLDVEISAGRASGETEFVERLTIEIYNPMSGEIFEAKFPKGRIEVDRDGSVTYFTTSSDHVNLSVFCGRNLTISMAKNGQVILKTPSRIISIDQDLESRNPINKNKVTSDSIELLLD